MIRNDEIARNRDRLSGAAPNGRLYEGKRDQNGRMIYTDISADPNARPPSWRANQSMKPMFDFIFSRKIVWWKTGC